MMRLTAGGERLKQTDEDVTLDWALIGGLVRQVTFEVVALQCAKLAEMQSGSTGRQARNPDDGE